MGIGTGRKVAVLGGGVGGLSAAHHLMKLGFEVHVYERQSEPGGKALSQAIEVDGKSVPNLGEHGFRFFPNFYTHLTSTLNEIELSPEAAAMFNKDPELHPTVGQLLLEAKEGGFAWGGDFFITARPLTRDPMMLVKSMEEFLTRAPGSVVDKARYTAQIMRFMTSCPERREAEYESINWLDFVRADPHNYSKEFVDFIRSIPRTLSAMDGGLASARTVGNVSIQLLFNLDPVRNHPAKTDALLCGPSSLAWLREWVTFLKKNKVTFHTGVEVKSLEPTANGRQIQRAKAIKDGQAIDIQADFFIASLPLERMDEVLADSPAVEALDPQLSDLRRLAQESMHATASMVGVQFLLKRQLTFCNGHVFYPRSGFALTSISQGQFWSKGFKQTLAAHFNVPKLEDVLSVIISDWSAVERFFAAKKQPITRDAIVAETWRQLTTELPGKLDPGDLILGRLDANVEIENGKAKNKTPLLVHPPSSYRLRPHAETAIENLMLAADYVATHTDLASMEGANEAARAAVAAIGRAVTGDPAFPTGIRPLSDGPVLAAAQELDRRLFRAGHRHAMEHTTFDFLNKLPLLKSLHASELFKMLPGAQAISKVADLQPLHAITNMEEVLKWQHVLFSAASGVADTAGIISSFL